MGIFDRWRKRRLDEATKTFKNRLKPGSKENKGEGYENIDLTSQSLMNSISSFNVLNNKYINKQHDSEISKIKEYRSMSFAPEISDVVEDAVIESTQEDHDDNIISLNIKDEKVEKNENMSNTLKEEFKDLFMNRLKLQEKLYNMLHTYYIDGRYYQERIGKNKHGISNLKMLPSETMDFKIAEDGSIEFFVQYLTNKAKMPETIEDGEKDPNVIVFYPSQISYVNSGMYGKNRKDIYGFLEKCMQPYNQLKLLETAVIIYRIIRAPERLVFRIDTGNMPQDKAMAYVEKVKQKFQQKETYDPDSGQIMNKPAITSLLENYFIPQCIRLDTNIPLLNGENKALRDIIDDYNNDIKNEVYSVDQKSGKIIKGEVEWAGVTRRNAELLRVWFDNDEFIDVTPDHKFVLRNGKEKEAQYLKENDSLMPYYTRDEKINSNSNEYKQIFDLKDNEWKFIHRIMGPYPKRGYAIHHVDFNRFNNQPDNLISMPIKEHIKLHYQSNKERNSHIPLLEGLNKPENREKQKIKAREYQIERWKDLSLRENQGKLMKERWETKYNDMVKGAKKPKTEQHKLKLKKSIENKFQNDPIYREKHAKGSKERWNNDDFRNHMSNVLSCKIDKKICYLLKEVIINNDFPSQEKLLNEIIPSNKKFMDYWLNSNEDTNTINKTKLGKHSFYKILNIMGFNDYTEFKNNIKINHRVVKVEKLDIREDTGCLTIKDPGENHNFAVGAGVFVKNSADGRGSQIDSIGGNFGAFSELDDIYYFQRKLYRSLKYPMSRVSRMHENQESDILFAGGRMGEVTRDEIKWAKYLERQQNRIAYDLKELFLIHLEFKGIKKEYDLNRSSFDIHFTPPNHYKDQLEQMLIETKQNNYQNLANNPEFPKTWLMARYLGLTEDDFKEIEEYHKKDKESLPQDDMGF